jgi:hypothetical protein
MADVRRELAVGLGALWLLSAVASGRARHAMLDLGGKLVSGGSARTRLEPSGPLGLALGRAARAEVVGVGGAVATSGADMRAKRTARPAHVRYAEFRYSDVDVLETNAVRLRAAIPDTVLDGAMVLMKGKARILRTGPIEVEIVLSAESIERYLRKRMPALRDARVSFADGEAVVELDSTLPPGRLVVACSVRPGAATGLQLVDARAWVDGVEMPSDFVASATQVLGTTILSAATLGWASAFAVKDARVTEGALRLVLAGRLPGD